VVKKKRTDRRSPGLIALALLITAAMPLSAFAQGSIFGTVQSSDLSTPANGDISFFGFLDDTDEEIRIETSTGAGYDAGNWFDDFQNYLTEAPGNPYDYYFYNIANDEGFHLAKLIPNNSFQQENIQLAAVAWPFKPTGLSGTVVSSSAVVVEWNAAPGMTYHVYRRVATSGSSFFRIDAPSGSLSNHGVADSFFVDVTVDGVRSYSYLIIAEDASGNYSEHSDVITVNSAVVVAPMVTSIVPISGLTLGGTSVSIYGSGFDMAGASAQVGTVLTGVSVVSPYHLTGVTQANPAGPANVSVTNLASGQVSNVLVGAYTFVSNSPPVLAAIGPQSGVEGTLITFTATATDADGGFPVMTSSTLPSGATYLDYGDGTGTFNWTPAFFDSGTYNVTFYATDDLQPSLVDSEQVVITVIEAGNQRPVLAAIGPQFTDENVNLNFTVTGTDPDLTIPALLTSTLPTGATFVDNGDGSGVFDWTPDYAQAGTHNITFYASDGALLDSEIVVITVNEVGNQPPVLTPIGPQLVTEGVSLNFAVTAADPDGPFPTLTTSVLPTGATFVDNGDGSGVFDWTPDFTQVGIYNVTFYATDGMAPPDSEVVIITVQDAGNQAPVLAAVGPQAGTENVNLKFTVTASDPDGTIPVLSTSTLPTGATFVDNSDGSGVFNWTPGFTDAGTYNVTFYAGDGALTDSEQVTITINESGNHAPVLDPIGDKFAFEGVLLVFPVTASDSDGTIPTLSTSVLPSGASFTDNHDGSGVFTWTPSYTQNGTYDVIFYASDGIAAPASEIVTITVSESGDQPPVITPIPDTSVSEGGTLRVVVQAHDPEGGFVSMSAYTSMPRVTFVDSGNGTAVLTYRPNYLDAGVDTVRIFATEVAPPYQASLETFVITTLETNQAPVFKPVGPFSVPVGDSLTFLITARDTTDANPNHVLYLSALGMPDNAIFVDYGNDTGRFTYHPDFGQEGVDTVTFRVVDQGTPPLSASMPVQITVLGTNIPPILNPIGPQLITEGATLIVNVTASDPDGAGPPALSVDTLHRNASFVDHLDGTGTYTFSPDFLQAGLYRVKFIADDGFDVTKKLVLIQVVEAGNQAPVFDPLPSVTVTEGLVITDSVTAHDPELQQVHYAVDPATVPNHFVFVDSGNGVAWFTFAPDYLQAGVYDITVLAFDAEDTATATLTIAVQEAGNQPPELSPLNNVTLSEGAAISFPVAASDVDGPTPLLSSSVLPGSATFNDLDGNGIYTFAWTTTYNDSGTYNIWFYATDADFPSDVDSARVIIAVVDVNRAPWLLIPFGQPDVVLEGDTLLFEVMAWDDDGSIPDIQVDINGTGAMAPNMTFDMTWDGTYQNGLLTFTPDYSQGNSNPTLYYLKFHAIDEFDPNLQDSTGTRTIKVYNRNQPPRINFSDSTWPFTISEGEYFELSAQAVDDQGSPNLRVENLPDSNYTLFQPTASVITFEFTPDFTQAGQYFLSFIATDNQAAADTAVIEINVTDAGNQPPVWSETLADTIDVFVGFPWTQVLTATDPESTPVTLEAAPVPTNASWDTTGGVGTYYFDPDFTQVGQVFQVAFIATDGTALTNVMVIHLSVQNLLRGDIDGNDKYTLNDVVILAGYIFRSGEAPYPMAAGDADMSGTVDVADIVYMINFLYHAGPRPPQ